VWESTASDAARHDRLSLSDESIWHIRLLGAEYAAYNNTLPGSVLFMSASACCCSDAACLQAHVPWLMRGVDDSKCETGQNKTPCRWQRPPHLGEAEDGRTPVFTVHLELTRNKAKRHMAQVEKVAGVLEAMVIGHGFICPGDLERLVGWCGC